VGYLFANILETSNGVLNASLRDIGLGALDPSLAGRPGDRAARVAAVNGLSVDRLQHDHLSGRATEHSRELLEAAGSTGQHLSDHVAHHRADAPAGALLPCDLGVIGTLKTFEPRLRADRGGPDHASEMPTTWMVSVAFNTFRATARPPSAPASSASPSSSPWCSYASKPGEAEVSRPPQATGRLALPLCAAVGLHLATAARPPV
jgi:hypothetical protein